MFGEDGILPGITQCMNGWFGAQRIMLCCAGLHPSQLCMSAPFPLRQLPAHCSRGCGVIEGGLALPQLDLEDTQRVWITPLGTPFWGLKHFAEGDCKAVDLTSQWALLPCLAPANNFRSFCSLRREARASLAVASLCQFHFRGFSSRAVARLNSL